MRQSEVIKYYSRPDVAREICRLAESRETIAQLGQTRGKRPDIIEMPGDVTRLARTGATSFHTSEEIWADPLKLSSEITEKEKDDLRTGWDLVIDIDSINVKYGKLAAKLILKAFEYHGLKNASLKYSGNKGFHIGVPFKALPKTVRGKPIVKLFPEVPRIVMNYLREFMRASLSEEILHKIGDIKNITKDTGKSRSELLKIGVNGWELDPYKIIELDEVLLASRHLCRMAYSLHEKSDLVSVVLSPNELDDFKMDYAKPANVKEIRDWFLNPDLVEEGEASQFIVQAFDWHKKENKEKEGENIIHKVEFEGEISKEAFPPCIKQILNGLEDGKKRALFVLANFFKCLNWEWDKIKYQLEDWNKKNKSPLKSGYLKSQLAWHRAHGKKVPPPNCDNAGYYKDIGVCTNCSDVKNPLTFVARKVKKKKR